jgi:Gas vesicle protein
MEQFHPFANTEMTLLDLLDGIIDTGVVVRGEILISIANIDLIVVDLKLLISSIESAFGTDERKTVGEGLLDGTVTTGFK